MKEQLDNHSKCEMLLDSWQSNLASQGKTKTAKITKFSHLLNLGILWHFRIQSIWIVNYYYAHYTTHTHYTHTHITHTLHIHTTHTHTHAHAHTTHTYITHTLHIHSTTTHTHYTHIPGHPDTLLSLLLCHPKH